MSKFHHIATQASQSIPEDIDVCVSFVLFGNSRDEIRRSIAQVRKSAVSFHIVLIDNSSPPIELADIEADDVTIIATNINLGYGRGHNIALSASKGRCRYNLIMNTDLEVKDDAIGGMVAFMDKHLDAGLAMPKVIYPDGSLQRLCRLLPDPANIVARRFLSGTTWAKSKNDRYEFSGWNYDSVAEFPFLSGCFMMCRRSVLDQIGYFDERYFLYAEDLDLSRRIHAVSKTLFNPSEVVIHEYRSQSTPSFARIRYACVSLVRYFSKWGWIVDQDRNRINQETVDQFR
ncbi:glycosyltransferase [Sphingomonas faeni]|uniref:glycosyltransferase n=1 Tax=Sphingomonas faeni TaxID=185950 RepID=UPI00278025DF|nr:glycosyltransferase family 2 protein [Sphingomonas faeni]MDQ0839808.1 GT2 family glycosyltransferase [Sphingomonas faeni]